MPGMLKSSGSTYDRMVSTPESIDVNPQAPTEADAPPQPRTRRKSLRSTFFITAPRSLVALPAIVGPVGRIRTHELRRTIRHFHARIDHARGVHHDARLAVRMVLLMTGNAPTHGQRFNLHVHRHSAHISM